MVAKLNKADLKGLIGNAKQKAVDGFSDLPNGQYVLYLESVNFGTSKKGDPMITHKWKVMDGELKDKPHKLFTKWEHEVSLSIMLGWWRAMGFDISTIEDEKDLEQSCKDVEEAHPTILASIYDNSANPQFKNFRIDNMVDTGEESTPVAEVKEEEEEKPAKPVKAPKAEKPAKAAKKPEPPPAEDEDEVADDDAASDDGEAAVELKVGTKITFTKDGVDLEGEIVEVIDGDSFKAVYVKPGKGKVKGTVTRDQITGVIEEG